MEANSAQTAHVFDHNRRAEQRFPLHLPIQIKHFGTTILEANSFTRDISARGAYFFLDFGLREGTRLEITVTLPSEVTLAEEIRVRCRGRVVRADQSSLVPKVGIAAVIEQYDFTTAK